MVRAGFEPETLFGTPLQPPLPAFRPKNRLFLRNRGR